MISLAPAGVPTGVVLFTRLTVINPFVFSVLEIAIYAPEFGAVSLEQGFGVGRSPAT